MVTHNYMSVGEFIYWRGSSDSGRSEEIYQRIKADLKKPGREKHFRLSTCMGPLYETDNGVFGGGDCHQMLAYREGYGYTIIEVGDKGSWYCSCGTAEETHGGRIIVFYDGEFEELVRALERNVWC